MQFLLHGGLATNVADAMVRQGHHIHFAEELSEANAPTASPEELLGELSRRQWCLLTADRDFIHMVYDRRITFSLCMVLLIAEPDQLGTSVDRLFDRYKRLSLKRLYTVTPGRVKVRQLPG